MADGKRHLKRTVKIAFRACCVISLAGLLVGAGYVFSVVHELQLKLETSQLRASERQQRPSTLEKGAIVEAERVKKFLTFAAKSAGSLADLEAEGILDKNGKTFFVNDTVSLPALLPNTCDRYLCLQSKLDFENIPSSLWKGLLGIEDYRFLQHQGVDPISIGRALVADIKAMALVQGGSTLTQQLAKNLFLTNEKKLERKLREMIYALYLERSFSKEEIITMYFNEVFWGTLGGVYLKGAHVAALAYFDKDPEELDDFEAAMLIGMLKGPYYYHPIRHLDRLKRRTRVVFERLRELRLLTDSNSQVWSDRRWEDWREGLVKKNEQSYLRSLYLVGENSQPWLEPYEKFVFYEAVESTRESLAKRVEGEDIAVKAVVVGAGCESLDCAEVFTYYSKFERDRRKALAEEAHQVGSILKPIIYQQFLEEGKSLDDMVSTAPITLDLISGRWTPSDASPGEEQEISLKIAIQKSRNIPLVRVSEEIGFDVLENRLIEYFPKLLTPLREYPAQLLGALELSLDQLSQAYLKFFKEQCQSFKQGESSYEESLLYILAQADQTTISSVAGKVIKQSLIFGKTGTSNNGLDNWYVAFDGQSFYAIWFGVESNRTGKDLRLYGSNSSFRIFQDFLQYRGKQISEFYCR